LKKRVIALCLLVFALLGAVGAFAHEDIEHHRSCDQCGMDRKAFAYSRMLILYEDGSQVGVCSLHCAVTELDQHKEKKVKSLLVADRDTRHLIDAEKAVWVLGGKKRGVMTDRAKWAFAATDAAQRFVDAQGGRIIGREEAVAAAREDAGQKPRQRR
jgi:nitrous oxide reductase accessory protein NosL